MWRKNLENLEGMTIRDNTQMKKLEKEQSELWWNGETFIVRWYNMENSGTYGRKLGKLRTKMLKWWKIEESWIVEVWCVTFTCFIEL